MDKSAKLNSQSIVEYMIDLKTENKVYWITQGQQFVIAIGNVCLYDNLGDTIDIFWDKQKANMVLRTSKQASEKQRKISYRKQKSIEILQNVHFRHAHFCPYFEKSIQKSQKAYKPCACVLIKNDKNFLITRRKLSLRSFPGAWVLPGGHLEKDQTLFEGGLREAEEEVGLMMKEQHINLQDGVMAWQSAFYKDGKILSCAFVLFFSAQVIGFEVKVQPQQAEIEEFKWKNILDDEDQWKYDTEKHDGYGEAHLNYLSFFRKVNFGIEEKKKWLSREVSKDKKD